MKKKKITLDELKIESFYVNPNPNNQQGGEATFDITFSYDCQGCFGTTVNSGCYGGGPSGPPGGNTYTYLCPGPGYTEANCGTINCPTDYSGCGGGATSTDISSGGDCNTNNLTDGTPCTAFGIYPGC